MGQEQIAALLAFLPEFEREGFCPGGVVPLDEDGYPEEAFTQQVSRFLDACYKNGFIVRFDWERWDDEARVYMSTPVRLQETDLVLLRRLLTWHVRQNRFARGHLAEMIARGHVAAILRRIRDVASS